MLHGKDSRALHMFVYPEHKFQEPDHNYQFHTKSLPYLLQMLFAMLYKKRSFRSVPTLSNNSSEMYVGYPTCFTRTRLQKEILEPFSAARGLSILSIDRNVDEIFASSLIVEMRRSWASGSELLEHSQAYLQKGDAAAAAGLTKAASLHFEYGADFTFFAGMSYLNIYHPPAEIKYMDLRIRSMRDAFDVRWAKVLLKLRCYADIRRVTVSILGRRNQSHTPSIDGKVELVLCCALASLALGQTSRFSHTMRGLVQGTCDLGVLTTEFGWTEEARPIFPDERSLLRRKDATIKEFYHLVAYCKEGEETSLRLMDTGGGLPDGKEIELPVAQDWSVRAARYEGRREKWARYEYQPMSSWI